MYCNKVNGSRRHCRGLSFSIVGGVYPSLSTVEDLLQKLKNSGIDTSSKMVMQRDPVADIESQVSEWEEDSRNAGEDEKTSNEYDDIESSINHKFEDKKREQMPIIDKKNTEAQDTKLKKATSTT
ncbi:hypothetical protein L1887_21599 [Cichorium endivia]|nr:hypothetical protein L1887_21599 [Cichorium endivia]